MDIRIEKDTMGTVEVPADKYWGAQTERSRNNFRIAVETMRMPIEITRAFAILKNLPQRQTANWEYWIRRSPI